MTKPPENLGYSRSGSQAGTARNGTLVPVPAVPPPFRAEQQRNPGTKAPSWLAEKVNTGRRAAHPTACPTCGDDTLVGPDHDTVAYTARVDPTDTGAIDEVIALLAGRHSFDYVRGDLHHRAPHHIHTTSRPYPVLLTHACTPEVLF